MAWLRRVLGVWMGGVAIVTGLPAAAQEFPVKPVRIVIPYTAGGPVDTVGRNLQGRLGEIWKQPVILDNKPGASAMIGSEFVAKAPPDGYTLLLGGVQTHAMNVATVKKMLYDPVRDFTPITQTTRANWILVTHPSVPARTPAELVTLLKANPGKYTYASSGVGGAAHLAMAMLSAELGLQLVHAPYKGTAQAVTDTVSGQVHMVMGDQSVVLPHVRAGRLNAIAMTGDVRSPLVPELPTISETLSKGFDVQAWQGLWGPPGMPRDLAQRINAAVVQALKTPEVTERLRAVGSETVGSSIPEFEAFVQREITRWTGAGKRAGIEPE
jgi:tripartite-type tricarboxylate transporter receptor subunit TctC